MKNQLGYLVLGLVVVLLLACGVLLLLYPPFS